ncbi:MAG: leucyl-tRNA synthetase, partial [Litorivivens sp.]
DACGAVAVPEADLPVVLPADVEFDGVGSPIKKMPEWYNTTCPSCGGAAVRETDTFDTFMESSWYYARFASSGYDAGMLDERAKYWGSVDHYVGGEEHAILHLLYARFFHKMMRDEGMVESDEPFKNLLALGMVLKDGVKMSKSAGDAGDPQTLLDAYGADAVRMAMMFAAPPEQSFEWSENGVESANRWLRTKLWNAVQEHVLGGDVPTLNPAELTNNQKELRRVVHETISSADDDYGTRIHFNTVVSSVMSLMNQIVKFEATTPQGRAVVREALEIAIIVISPITPHISQELWRVLTGGDINEATWPLVDRSALKKTVIEMVVQINGKLRAKFETSPDTTQADIEAEARALENVAKFIEGKTIRKVIVVPNKLVNFVVT